MSRNFILCALGIVLGFGIGFFIANAVSRPGANVPATRASSITNAGPLDEEQSGGRLPPGHPDINNGGDMQADTNKTGASAASTSAEAQAAMDKADRNTQDFDAQMSAAKTFYASHDFEKSALYFDRSLALKPQSFEALAGMGNTKYDARDYVGAASYYERALAINPDEPDVRTDFGNTFFNRIPHDYDRAIAEYRKSIQLDPNHLNSWKNIATAALLKRDKTVATEALKHLEELDARNPDLSSLRDNIEALP